MMEVEVAGPEWTGSFEFAPDCVTIYAAPSDPDARPGYTVLSLDPTPAQARAVAQAFAEWADMIESQGRANAQTAMLGLMP